MERARVLVGGRWRLVKLDRIAVGIVDEDLPSARPHLDGVAEMDGRLSERLDASVEVVDVESDAVPATRRLGRSIRHRARPRAAGAAEQQAKAVQGHRGKGGIRLLFQPEAEKSRVEGRRAVDVGHL